MQLKRSHHHQPSQFVLNKVENALEGFLSRRLLCGFDGKTPMSKSLPLLSSLGLELNVYQRVLLCFCIKYLHIVIVNM